MKVLKTFLAATFSFTISFVAGQTASLTKTFPASTPEEQGIDAAPLDSMLRFIRETQQNVHHLTMIRNGRTVLDTDIYPYSSRYMHDIASVTKSLVSLLTGIAIDKGFIKSKDEKIIQYFPEIKEYDKRMDSITVRHLVTMTSGLACNADGGEQALAGMVRSRDWVQYVFSLPVVDAPGKKFAYCSCNFYLLGEIIFRTTHLTPHEFAKKYFFNPLGIKGSRWLTNAKNIQHGWGDLFLYPADMAKIGQLILNNGRWNNMQVISEQWVTKCLQTFVRIDDNKGYGYGWWTFDKGGYYEAAGRGRQLISVLPELNMVVVMLGGEFNADRIGEFMLRSIKQKTPLPANKKALVGLESSIKQVAAAPLLTKHPSLPLLATTLNNRTIVLDSNVMAIDSIRFAFGKKSAVTFYKNGKEEKHAVAISPGTYALSMDPVLHLPVAMRATFSSANSLVLDYNQLCRINHFLLGFQVQGSSVKTTLEETSNFIKVNVGSELR